MNIVFPVLVTVALLFAMATGNIDGFTSGLFAGVKAAVDVALGLVGALGLWLGAIRVLEKAGALEAMGRVVGPFVVRLFPGLPKDHEAIPAITLNVAANMLGLGNAATPFGLKAMEAMEKLNPHPGTATDAQALFMALNTASVTLVPATVIAMRATAKPMAAAQPADILLPTLLASGAATVAALLASRLLSRLPMFKAPEPAATPAKEVAP